MVGQEISGSIYNSSSEDRKSMEISNPNHSQNSALPNSLMSEDQDTLSQTAQLICNKRLHYVIHSCSSTSSTYAADNILEDKPNDQSSRWSSDTSTPPQYLILKLEPRPAIVTSITFGKYEKAHVCNLKRFKVFGGCEENNMIELIDSGLKNDTSPETFPLRHSLNNHYFPCRYIKIVPLQSWGPSFNFSIWHVSLEGEDSTGIIEPSLAWHDQFREKEAIRLCLKHFRQKNYNEVFNSLQRKTNIQLEHPRLTELHNALVRDGNYETTERLISQAIKDGLFDDWINAQKPSPRWTPLILPEEKLADDLLSGNASPAVQTPLANSGNITPDDDNQIADRESMEIGGQGGENEGNEIVENSNDRNSNSAPKNTNSGSSPALPLQPVSRGGHQMVIDSSSQLVYLFGGWDGNKDLSDFWSYHIPTNKWTLISIDTSSDGGPSPRSCHKMVIDVLKKHIFILGRYLDKEIRKIPQNIKSDFFMYDITANRWTQITDDTAAMGGPSLIFDHQMCIDQDTRTIYVFGGQSLFNTQLNSAVTEDLRDTRVQSSDKIYSGLYEYHIPTNTWRKKRDDIAVGSSMASDCTVVKTLKSRSSHSMLFHPKLRKLFIFGGQRKRDEYLNDFFTYGVDNDEVEVITSAKGSGLAGDPSAAIPAVGHTQRATIDCHRSEIHVMTGLNKDKDKNDKRASSASSESRVSNSFWVYSISSNKWTCFYRNDNSSSTYWREMQRQEPRPRYAHQLVYDDVNRMHFMFGGNPGGKRKTEEGKEDEIRLGDFWQLHLVRPDRKEIFRRCCLKARQSCFMELTYDENSLAKALSYLQTMLSDIVDHNDDEEEREYQLLASQLFKFPPLPLFQTPMVCPIKKSRSFDGASKTNPASFKNPDDLDSEDSLTKIDKRKHKLRTQLFDTLSEHFPSDMTHPAGNLIDLIPHPVDLS